MSPKVWVKAMVPVAAGVLLVGTAAGLVWNPVYGQTKTGGTPTGTGSGTGTGTTGTGTGTTNPTTTGRTTGTTNTNPTQNQQQQPTSIVQPIFVTGRVTLEDGTAPPEPVVIESV